jgi:hypothetical protein
MRKHAHRGLRPPAALPKRETPREKSLGFLREGAFARPRASAGRGWNSAAPPIAALAVSILAFVFSGRSVPEVVETNLPTPLVTVAEDPIRLAHPTFAIDDRYVVTATRSGDSATSFLDARLKVQLHTEGRSRLLSVRADGSRFPQIQLVPHLGWIDIGRVPPTEARKAVSVRAILGGRFGFISPNVPKSDAMLRIAVGAKSSAEAIVAVRSLRYRLVETRPVGARESIARLLFFPTCGWISPVAACLALAGLLAGWLFLCAGKPGRGAAALASSVLLLHATLLPPLMGGDETSHSATVESSLIPHEDATKFYPGSLSEAALALEIERVQYRSDERLPLESPSNRDTLRMTLRNELLEEARLKGAPPPTGYIIQAETRAPAYYAVVTALSRPLERSRIIDRLAAYRLVGVVLVALLAGLAAWTGLASGGGPWIALAAGLLLLLPYSVAVVASTSNYSPAIGFGLLGAAGVVAGVAGTSIRGRLVALGVGFAAFVVGIPFWSDFALGLGILLSLLPLLIATAISQQGRNGPGRPSLFASGVVLLGGITVAAAGRPILERVIAGLPRAQAAFDAIFRSDIQARLPYAGAPLVLLLAGLVYIRQVSKGPKARAKALARRATALLALLVVGGAIALPWTGVSYGYVQAPRTEQLSHFLRSLLSNAFSWDQDLLGWKLWWGVFGWADTYSSPLVYALARWGVSLIIIASPLLVLPYARRRPQRAALLLAVSCFALVAVAVSFLIRLNGSVFPYGRFFLPFFPLVALPLLAMMQAPGRLRKLQAIFSVAVLFHIWVAVHTLGTRYYFGK